MFTLLTCADMFGSKVNLELTFSALPTIGELTRRVEEVFTAEMHAIKPPGAEYPPEGIKVNRLQVYDDVLLKWVDLVSSTQLHEYDQVYVFQPQTPWSIDTQQDLPAPRPPTGGGSVAPVQPPPQSLVSHPQGQGQPQYGVPPTPAGPAAGGYAGGSTAPHNVGYYPGATERRDMPVGEKTRVVFDEMDGMRKGFIDHADFERAFRERGLDFSANTIGELFYKGDLNRDGRITLDEWQNFALIYPNTVDTMYFKGRNTTEEAEIQRQIAGINDQVRGNQDRDAQIRKEIELLEAANAGLADDIHRYQAAAAEAARRKVTLDHDERELIEEEVKLERQNDQMRLTRARFQAAQDKFNRGAAAKGSPRRAREAAY